GAMATRPLEAARQEDPAEQEHCRPPSHETVEWHLTEVVEAYLPSHVALLDDRLRRTGWGKSWPGPGREVVPSLRSGPIGGSWTQLVTLSADASPGPLLPSGKTYRLPTASRGDPGPLVGHVLAYALV